MKLAQLFSDFEEELMRQGEEPESLSFVLLDLDGENPEQCLTVYNGDK